MLIVGCGCRGRQAARGLADAGHAVRGTSRDPGRLDEIGDAGAEPVLADPDRVGTLVPALAGVTVVVRLLGRAAGPPESVAALHGPRLRALLEKLVDTPVRGYVHEVAQEGDEALVRQAARTWAIPVRTLAAPADPAEVLAAVASLLDSPAGQTP